MIFVRKGWARILTDIGTLADLIEPEAKALGFDLVRVKLLGSAEERTLQVMAERPDTRQLAIDDCAALSRRLSDKFDALEAEGTEIVPGAYRLEVSSPGIDRPLTRLRDFADWTGHEARITLAEKRDGRRQFKGELAGVEPEGDVVKIGLVDGTQANLPFDAIEDAKLTLTDRLIAASQPVSADGADDIETDEPEDEQED